MIYAIKAKADGLKKISLTGQILWFVVQFVERYFEGSISKRASPLEIFTVAIAALICIGSPFWLHKPLDVQRPIVLPGPAKDRILLGHGVYPFGGNHDFYGLNRMQIVLVPPAMLALIFFHLPN